MKRFLLCFIKFLSAILAITTLVGSIPAFAMTVPEPDRDYMGKSVLTYSTSYFISPSDHNALDGFGVKNAVGIKKHVDGTYHYLELFEFYAGGEQLPFLCDTIFSAYGVNVTTGEVSQLSKAAASTDIQYKYQMSNDGKLCLYKYRSNSDNYNENDVFIATPTKKNDFVLVFTAPEDGTYSFTEELLKRYTVFSSKAPTVTYAAIKAGEDNVLDTVTSKKTSENESDTQKYELNGKVTLKKDEKLLFVMSVSDDATANDGFYTRIQKLKVTCGNKVYDMKDYPPTQPLKGYGKGNNVYFSYDFSGKTRCGTVFNMCLGEQSPSFAFVAPFDGRFKLTVSARRAESGNSLFKAHANGETLSELEVGTTKRNYDVNVTLKAGERLYLEYVSSDGNDSTVLFDKVSVTVPMLRTGEKDKEYDNAGQSPIYTVAMFTDIHSDGILPTKAVPVKKTFTNAVNYLKSIGGADTILVGGDTLSEGIYHTENIEKSKWTYENTKSTVSYIDTQLRSATKTGKNVFYVAGNHDKQPGVIVEKLDPSKRLLSSDYSPYMLAASGDYDEALYLRDLVGVDKCRYPGELLCYRYNVGGMEYIGINQPYGYYADTTAFDHGAHQFFYPQQITWVSEQLEKIGKDKTVIVLCHYNFQTDGVDEFVAHGANQSHGQPVKMLAETLEQYPNAIYCYGHVHWRDEDKIAWYNTSEHIWSYGNKMQLDDGSYVTDGYHFLHMGSINYTATMYNQGSDPSGDSAIAQLVLADFYNDHITIRTVNIGTKSPDPEVFELTTYTIKREMTQLDAYTGDGDTTLPEIIVPPVDPDREEKPEEPMFLYDPSILTGNIKVQKEDSKKLDLGIMIAVAVSAVVIVGGVTAALIISKKRKNKV